MLPLGLTATERYFDHRQHARLKRGITVRVLHQEEGCVGAFRSDVGTIGPARLCDVASQPFGVDGIYHRHLAEKGGVRGHARAQRERESLTHCFIGRDALEKLVTLRRGPCNAIRLLTGRCTPQDHEKQNRNRVGSTKHRQYVVQKFDRSA